MNTKPYSLFSVYGIEIEYMIVDQNSLEIQPITDKVIEKIAGEITNEVECDKIAVSNELMLHVIELKTNGPTSSLDQLDQYFHQQVKSINQLLGSHQALLMPTGAHPWLAPSDQMKLWPHGDRTIYQTYHKIFNCQGHGWSNLQSVHINLPYANDDEFIKLHNAIRILLPIIPALSASTPFIENQRTQYLDTRLFYYGKNQQKIPLIAGEIIPEFISTQDQYHKDILHPIYKAIAANDPDGILQHDWLNSRGAIPKFDRGAVEIRIIDSQECPKSDIAIAATVCCILKYIIDHNDEYLTKPLNATELKSIYDQSIVHGMDAEINHANYLSQLTITNQASMTVHAVLNDLIQKAQNYIPNVYLSVIDTIMSQGNLASRLVRKTQSDFNLKPIYHTLCDCLQNNELFLP